MLAPLPVYKTLFYTPASAREAVSHFLDTHSLKSSWDFQPQVSGPDLGYRLAGGLEQARARLQGAKLGSSSVAFIGMDCFDLTPSRILGSFSLASASSAYMLPASDGGYVLLTVPLGCPSIIFDRIPWSCERTANIQITRLAEAGLSCILGEELGDVDEPEDLEQLWKSREQKRLTHPRTFKYLETVMKDSNQDSQATSKLPD
ncbi:hypothetical protein DL764_010573 [Monosporascus ibericus]|uniref:Glycosyltransferase n=1 Tax=Monosporascus ibericus TaxID=155417 RepID=A0A4Q4SSM4_9PEZI|nr:hypothetical protein DL764_010573 [Monosporascus ibericus]